MNNQPIQYMLKWMALGFFLLAISFSKALSATTNTSSTGLWNTGGNWDNGIPGGTDDANINHAMTIDGNIASTRGDYTFNSPCVDPVGGGAFNLSVSGTGGNEGIVDINANVTFEGTCAVSSNGTLIVRTGDTLIIGATTFANGSTVNIESGAVVIINGDLANNNNSTGIIINGNLFVNGNVNGGNGSAITGTGGINATGTITTDPPTGSIFGSTGDCTVPPCSSGPGAVPIELNYFLSRSEPDHILLEWETLSETDNSYFILDRSRDGNSFEEMARIPGAGTSQEIIRYSFQDFNVKEKFYYYRLWQVDFDETKSFLGILAQSFTEKEHDELLAFPNPIAENASIKIDLPGSEEIQLLLVNAQGIEVRSWKRIYDLNEAQFVDLEFSGIQSGLYNLILDSSHGRSIIKVVKK